MQGRRAVEQHRMLPDHLVEDVPDFRTLLLDQLLGLLDRRRIALGIEPRVDERLEQLERHLLRQAALVQLQVRAGDDHRTPRIVDPLAQKVLAEAALLALQHVGQRFQRALVGAGDDPAAAAVVEQRVDGFLQHPLLVADDDTGSPQFDQPLQAVVAIDDAAVEVVEVGGGETAAVQRHQGAKVRRNYRHHRHDHPFGLVARLDEVLDDLQPLHQFLGLELGRCGGEVVAQFAGDLPQIHRREKVLDRLGADQRRERILAELVDRQHVLLLRQELMLLQRGEARFGDDVVLEIEDALDILERHVHQRADPARQRLQEPDMGDRRGQFDVAHAFAPHARKGDLDAALLADDALVLHPLVLAAKALVVLDRTEDAGAEQPVALGLERAVVDGLRLFDFAERPGEDLFRRCERDSDRVESLRRHLRIEDVHDLLVHGLSPSGALAPGAAGRGNTGRWKSSRVWSAPA